MHTKHSDGELTESAKRHWLIRLVRYWLDNIKVAKDGYSYTLIIAAFLCAFFSLLCYCLNLPNPVERFIVHFQLAEWGTYVALFFAASWALLVQPFTRHELDNEKNLADRRQLVEINDKAVDALMKENKTLQGQLNDRANAKILRTRLGKFHELLTYRVAQIREAYAFEYNNQNEDSFKNGRLDANSSDLITEVGTFIEDNLDGGDAAIFWDRTDVKHTPLPVGTYVGDHGRFKHWLNVIDTLTHHAKQLMKIIESNNDEKIKF